MKGSFSRDSKYELILIDADGTLFDYEMAERHALAGSLRDFGITDGIEGLASHYKRINARLWADLEQGKISKDALRTERFNLLFQQHDLNVDVHAFSECYLDYLAHSSFLIEGADEICRYLHKRARLVIVTNGIREVQLTRLAGSSIKPTIHGIVVSEEVGAGKPDPAIFEYALALASHSDKDSVIMIGDSLTADILGGIRFGIDTCWVNLEGGAGNDSIRPTYEVRDLSALKQIMQNILIREEQETDWYESEYITKKAFWNLHVPGCNEHYLVHLLRSSEDYLPELSRVAEIDGKLVGLIMYTKAYVMDGEKRHEVLTFGPLCIDPVNQKQGIGGRLLEVTMQLAREHGHRAIIIYGEPEYYPRFGFKTCDHFGITTHDDKNFDAFMALELVPGGLDGVKGKFHEAQVFEDCNSDLAEEYDKKFPYMKKEKLPGQWE